VPKINAPSVPRDCPAQMSRPERNTWVREQLDQKEALRCKGLAKRKARYLATCERCRTGGFCLFKFTVPPGYDAHERRTGILRGIIYDEQADEKYAQYSRQHGVNYKHHVGWILSLLAKSEAPEI
jgi:hypothetical protein